jgi:ligand-binding sensor domain-containing protein
MRRAARSSIVLVMLTACVVRGERLPLRTYTSADGLAHNSVHRIVRDSRGFLWFCTSEGLSQFDGYEFKKYGTAEGLPHRDALGKRAARR